MLFLVALPSSWIMNVDLRFLGQAEQLKCLLDRSRLNSRRYSPSHSPARHSAGSLSVVLFRRGRSAPSGISVGAVRFFPCIERREGACAGRGRRRAEACSAALAPWLAPLSPSQSAAAACLSPGLGEPERACVCYVSDAAEV